MSESNGAALVLRLSVPAAGGLRGIATELGAKVAEYLGSNAEQSESIGSALEGLAGRVAPAGIEGEIAFEFRRSSGELLIEARCEGQASELRYPLPA
jgi:hypothetical protein